MRTATSCVSRKVRCASLSRATNGVEPKSAEIGFFSLQPVYDYKDAKRRVIGYRVSNSVSLKLKDFAKVGPIVQQLGAQEFNENVNLGYMLEDIDAAKLRAVEDAFQRARAEAATLAKAGNRTRRVAAGVAGYGRGGEQPQQEYLPAAQGAGRTCNRAVLHRDRALLPRSRSSSETPGTRGRAERPHG